MLFAMLLTLYAESELDQELASFNEEQLAILKKSYELGKPYDLGFTLASIAWQESRCGKYKIAVDEDSYGPYQMRVMTALHMTGTQDTRWNRNIIAQRLHDNIHYAGAMALTFLVDLKERYGWARAVRYYNTGKHYRTSDGNRYLSNIQEKIRALQKSGLFQ